MGNYTLPAYARYCELNTDKEHAHCGDPEEEDEEEVASQPKRVKKPKGWVAPS